MKVVINAGYGGYSLSDKAIKRLAELKGITAFKVGLYFYTDHYAVDYFDSLSYLRDDKDLVQTVEELGEAANTRYSRLIVVEIPDGVDYYIDEYDGYETIHEKHRTWG